MFVLDFPRPQHALVLIRATVHGLIYQVPNWGATTTPRHTGSTMVHKITFKVENRTPFDLVPINQPRFADWGYAYGHVDLVSGHLLSRLPEG